MSFEPGHVLQGDGYAYEILRTLGRGGMGEVYLALDNVGRRVALKTIKPQLWQKSDFRDRFQQEARVMGQLVHPYIIRMLSYFTRQDTAFIVMEFVEGTTLSDLIREEPWVWREALPRFLDALDALAYAHQKGVIHRDIKPSNFILDAEQGHLKVMDFGLAYIRQTETQADEAEARLTKVGLRAGTLKYMPPEQLRDLTATDERSDIYALGMTFYKVLAGALPFDGLPDQLIFEAISRGSLPPRARDTVMEKLGHTGPDLPPEHLPPPHAFNRALPPALSAILMKAIAHDPDDRYPTARAMRDALEAFEQASTANDPTLTMMAGDEATMTMLDDATATVLDPETVAAPAFAHTQPPTPTAPATTGPTPALPPEKSRWPLYAGSLLLVAVALVAAAWLLPDLINTADPETPTVPDSLNLAVNDTLTGGSVAPPLEREQEGTANDEPDSGTRTNPITNPDDEDEEPPTPTPLGTLALIAQGGTSAYSIWVDGDEVGTGDLRLRAGAHQIACLSRGQERDTTVTVPANGSLSLTCHFEAYVSANMATETNELTFGTWIVNGDTLRDARYRNRGLTDYRLPVGEHRIQAGKYGQFTEPYVFAIRPSFQRQERRLPSFTVPSL